MKLLNQQLSLHTPHYFYDNLFFQRSRVERINLEIVKETHRYELLSVVYVRARLAFINVGAENLL